MVPALDGGFAATRAKSVARLLKYLREAERLGPEFARQELDEIGALLGRPFDDVEPARQRGLRARSSTVSSPPSAVLPYCLAPGRRVTPC